MDSFEAIQPERTVEVEGENPEEGSGKSPKPEKKLLSTEGLEQYRLEAQETLDSYRKLFDTFARDISLKFVLGDKFFINFDKGEINLDTKWFADKNFSIDQILWATMHELSHFVDLSDDPKGMLKHFGHIKEKTKKTAEKVVKKYRDSGELDAETLDRLTKRPPPDKDGDEQLTPAEQQLYKIHHSFYNAIDDIYVNNIVSRKAPKFEEKRKGGQEIKRLYKEKLFVRNDYSKLARHVQFLQQVLRREMIRDEEVIVSDDVKEALESEVVFEGKKYTVNEIIEKFIKPRTGRDTKSTRRYKVIQQTLEPIFDKLLEEDLKDWDPSKDKPEEQSGGQDGQEGDGDESGEFDSNPFSDDYKEFDESNPDQISEEDIKQWMYGEVEKKERQKEKENNDRLIKARSSAEDAKKVQQEMDEDWAKENKVDIQNLREFRKLEEEVAPYLEELSRLWRDIVTGSTEETARHREGYFPTGDLNLPRVIDEWPKIEKREIDDVRVMERTVDKEAEVEKPELIRVRLVGDISGSMRAGEKIHILRQSFVLLLSSLKEFDMYLNMNRQSIKSKLQVDTEAWVFSTDPRKIKSLKSQSGIENEQQQIIKTLNYLNHDPRGNTYDDKALSEIKNSINQEDREKIAKGKIMEIVFEITDGVPNEPGWTKKEIEELENLGVIIRGFQIGEVDSRSEETFNIVWNTGGKIRGEVVGENVQKLIPAITSALKKYLKNVRL